jgi:hypothetical protein
MSEMADVTPGDVVRRSNVRGLVVVDVVGDRAVLRPKSDAMGPLIAVPLDELEVYDHLNDAELAAVQHEIAELARSIAEGPR